MARYEEMLKLLGVDVGCRVLWQLSGFLQKPNKTQRRQVFSASPNALESSALLAGLDECNCLILAMLNLLLSIALSDFAHTLFISWIMLSGRVHFTASRWVLWRFLSAVVSLPRRLLVVLLHSVVVGFGGGLDGSCGSSGGGRNSDGRSVWSSTNP